MTTISLKLPETLARRLEAQAQARKVTRSELVRECLERVLVKGERGTEATFHELARDLCGSFRGPCDLASNPKHLDGLGR